VSPKSLFPIQNNTVTNVKQDELTENRLNTSIAICAIFKNEAPNLEEWIRFHRLQGVNHFYLYDNLSEDNFQASLQPHLEYTTVIPWTIPFWENAQKLAYVDCIEQFQAKHRWIAFIDIDEFLFGVKQPLAAELQAYEYIDEVLVKTICYGTSGLVEVPQGSATQYLVRRAPLWWPRNNQKKCIVNPKRVQAVDSVHEMIMVPQARFASGDGQEVPSWNRQSQGWIAFRLSKLWGFVSSALIRRQVIIKLLPSFVLLLLDPYGGAEERKRRGEGVTRIRINHYVIRSAMQYREKVVRYGKFEFGKLTPAYFKYHDQNQVYDPILSDWESGGMYR